VVAIRNFLICVSSSRHKEIESELLSAIKTAWGEEGAVAAGASQLQEQAHRKENSLRDLLKRCRRQAVSVLLTRSLFGSSN
jgi:hypothetical protein